MRLLQSPGHALTVGAEDRTPCADSTPARTRCAAILYIGRLRRSELAGLAVADWTSAPSTLRIRHGKGDKKRLVPLVGAAVRALDNWVVVRGHSG